MHDLDHNPSKIGTIRLVFKKKNLGKWESFIKPNETKEDVESHQIEGKHLQSLESSNEDADISRQLTLMHVTMDSQSVHFNNKDQESLQGLLCLSKNRSLNFEQFSSFKEDFSILIKNKQYNSNLDLAKYAQDNLSSHLNAKDESISLENVQHAKNEISCTTLRSSLETETYQSKIIMQPPDETSYEDVFSFGNAIGLCLSRGLSDCPTLYLLPEFNDPLNLPRPPSHPLEQNSSLFPVFPVVQVMNFEDAQSESLQEFCSKKDCCLLRGLCKATNLKLELFSTATLRQTFGEYNMEIRVQRKFRNSKRKAGMRAWNFQSKPSSITINQFAKYQALSFLKATSENGVKCSKSSRKEIIHFGTNVDLSNLEIWKEQLQELEKLPDFLRVSCPEINMLNHIGHNVLGVNTVQLYMKVPGCRTPGHQENNNFSAINVNIGPGSCEWFCVAECYWGVIYELCKKNGISYSSGSWWPDLKDLFNNSVPVYRVIQEPGDVIWIGPGTIHWVQSIGWCNNVAWNVGPMSDRQFRSAIERYEYNRIDPPYKSIVPMVQLSWNLAQHFLKQDPSSTSTIDIKYAEGIFRVISASLRYCKEVLIKIQKLGKRSVRQDRLPSDLAHYCEACMNEVFNIIFAHKNLVYCFACALKKSACLKDFYVLEEYSLDGLQNIVDEFATKIVTFS